MTLSMDKMFEFFREGAYDFYYRDINQNYVNTRYQSGDDLMACLHFPDITSTLGRHLLYRFELTFRAVPHYNSTNIWMPHGYVLGYELPDLYPGSQYVRVSMNIRVPFFLEPIHGIPGEPGADFSLTAIKMTGGTEASAAQKSEFTYNALNNQVVLIEAETGTTDKIYTTLLNGTAPYLTIYYDDTEVVSRYISSVTGITSGYWNPRYAHTIGWTLSVSSSNIYKSLDTVINPVTTVIYWRESGGNWNTISVPSRASSYDVPANTFPTGKTIEWYISVTDEDGITSTSSTKTVSTDDDDSTATPTAPVNTIEIGNKPITFTWTVENPSGAPPTRVKAEWTTDPAGTWTPLFDESSAIYSYTAPANTFPGGNIYWRITSYNADSEAGPTSDPAVFSCIAPPSPPSGVTSDTSPFATISWQAAVQTAFEILVDGKLIAKKFGIGVYSYQMQEPLADGEHTIAIRVQGSYGYWSSYTTTTVTTENTGTGSLVLSGRFDVDADLSWVFASTDTLEAFRIYRDGVMIARTSDNDFRDRLVLGEHTYTVMAELAGGYYICSADVSGRMKSCVTRIAPAAGGDWLELTLSENSNSVQAFAWNRSVTLRHYAGSVYPVAEFSPYEDRTASFDCAFKTVAEAKAFEALRGKVVILKSRGGEVTIGPLAAINKTAGDFYITYQFTVSQIHWEDFIDDTDS